jgi:phosphatidylinositol alpha-1,6-mannosyltransferase
MAAAAAGAVIRTHADVVHCARVIPEGLVGLLLHQTLGVRYTVWVHGEEVSMYMRYPTKRRLMPEVFRRAHAVLCNSSFSRGQAHSAGTPTEKLHVVNPCVDWARFQSVREVDALRERHRLAGKTVVLSVGRLTRRKGHDHMLQALARLRRRDVVYLVLSDGELEAELHNLARELDLEGVVQFVGPVSAAELPAYYRVSDVFAMPNRVLADGDVEGFGLVFLEASASGLAVIGGRSGGVVDAVAHEETGLLVDGASVSDVASALARLLDDRALRRRFGERGRQWTRERFDWTAASRSVLEISTERDTHALWREAPRSRALLASLYPR